MTGVFKPGAKLIVASHVSCLDIIAIHAVYPQARFVSKADVKTWPLANRLVAAADTLYSECAKTDQTRASVEKSSSGAGPTAVLRSGFSLLKFCVNPTIS